MNPVYSQFDYSTISDVIIHMQYTARHGGEDLRTAAIKTVKRIKDFALVENRSGLYLLISSRHEFGTNWQKFLNSESGKPQTLSINIASDRFPFFTNGLNITIKGIDFAAKLSDSYTLIVTLPGEDETTGTMEVNKEILGYLHHY